MPWSDYLAQKKRVQQFGMLAPKVLAALDQVGATLWGDNGPWFPKYRLSSDGLSWILCGTSLGRLFAHGPLAPCRLVIDVAAGAAFRITLHNPRSAFPDRSTLCQDLSGAGLGESLARLIESAPIAGATRPAPLSVAVTRYYKRSMVGRLLLTKGA